MKQQKPEEQHKEEIKKEEQAQQQSVPVQDEALAWKTKYIRALADYQNLQKRTEDERQEMRLYATGVFLKKLLPVVDDLERAQSHVQDPGLALAMKQLQSVLVGQGVTKIDVVGKPFDPYMMECIEVVEGKKDTVIREVTPGYMYFDKLLREAKVNVGGGETQKQENK